MNKKRSDISRNCFYETIPWMIVLIILFIINTIIGIIDWFPRFPVNRSDMGVTVYEIPTGCDHQDN